MKDKDRYWQSVCCKVCGKHMGFAPYDREAYQCTECNDMPKDWDHSSEWLERWEKAYKEGRGI